MIGHLLGGLKGTLVKKNLNFSASDGTIFTLENLPALEAGFQWLTAPVAGDASESES